MLFGLLAFLFIAIPVAELQVLWIIGNKIGIMPTLGLVIITGVVGAHLARYQGLMVIKNINGQLSSGKMPGDELISGALVLVGGVMLLTPGIITDCTGLLLMLPFIRRIITLWLKKYFAAHFNIINLNTGFNSGANNFSGNNPEIKEADAHIIEDENE